MNIKCKALRFGLFQNWETLDIELTQSLRAEHFFVGFPKCIFTKFFFTVCYENKQPVLVTYRNIKRSKKWSDCKKECDQDGDCQYFRWKVMKEISCLVLSLDNFSLQNNRKWKKRVCYLMQVQFKPKNNYISGERFCG